MNTALRVPLLQTLIFGKFCLVEIILTQILTRLESRIITIGTHKYFVSWLK